MKIVDTNILNFFVKGDILLDISEEFYFASDLKDEIENLKTISLEYKNIIQKIKFINIENHRHFDESKYLEHYKNFINKHNKITSFYGLKGLGDISIIASVAMVLDPVKLTLFDSIDEVEVYTHDANLKEALRTEFADRINIIDPFDI